MEPIKSSTAILKILSCCLNKIVDSIKNLKSDPLKFTLLMGIVFSCSAVATHFIFDDIYITCFISFGVLFLGYMGYLTYTRDQERKAQEKINGRLQSIAEEIARARVRPGKKNG